MQSFCRLGRAIAELNKILEMLGFPLCNLTYALKICTVENYVRIYGNNGLHELPEMMIQVESIARFWSLL